MEQDQRQKRDDLSSRLLSRVGSVFRRASRRTKSTVSAQQIEEPRTPAATSTPASAAAGNTTAAVSTTTPDAPQTTQTSTAAGVTAPTRDATQAILWRDIQQERARALFAKYGLTLEPQEWMSPRNFEVRRVEKPIRMRVRRTCHRCQTTFGSDRVCSNCQHVRCKTCPRYPPARTKEEKEARALAKAKGKQPEKPSDPAAAAATIEPSSDDAQKIESTPLTMESRTGGQDVIYKEIKQRVRRTCHQCQTLFLGTSTVCESCGHIRCKQCPREPAKLDKYPDGYPGDAESPVERPLRVWKKPRMRVRYLCHKCDTIYVPGENICATCGEEKGLNTRRDPPKRKEKPPIDEELLKRVHERLEEFRIAANT